MVRAHVATARRMNGRREAVVDRSRRRDQRKIGLARRREFRTEEKRRTVRAALPLLRRADWARIVNVSAMSTKRQSATLVAYTAAKNALTSLTKNLSMSLAEDGILVNTVSPGTYVSESLKSALRPLPGVDEEDLYDVMRFITSDFGHPVHLNRAGDPKEIGPVIAFVASARNTYMTGANINVDGGSDFT